MKSKYLHPFFGKNWTKNRHCKVLKDVKNSTFHFKVFILPTVFLPILLLLGCSYQHFAPAGTLYKALHSTETDTSLTKDSQKIIAHFQQFRHDPAKARQLLRFQQGCYLLQMDDDIIKLPRIDGTNKDSIAVTGFKIANADTVFANTDYVIYLVFLDQQRVLYHSPYRRIYFKDGASNDSVNVNQWGKLNAKRYAAKTLNYFKLGIDTDYSSVRRGYYKIDRDGHIGIWLETYLEDVKDTDGKRIVLTEIELSSHARHDTIRTMHIKKFWYRDESINIKRLDFNRTPAEFHLHKRPFKLLVMTDGKVSIIDSISQDATHRFYFPQKRQNIRPAALKPEKITDVYTY